jgi:Tol biopolymer transport system component
MVDGNEDIWIKELPDGPESRLTRGAAAERMPRWAPDGLSVTFRSDRSGVSNLWSMSADGTGEAEVLFDQDALAMGFWSPAGDWLVLRRSGTAGNMGARDILAFRPGVDSVATPLVADPTYLEEGPDLSPDGRWLAYTSTETGRHEVFVRPFPDVESGKWQVSREGGIQPLWGPDGLELFFLQDPQGGAATMMTARLRTEPEFEVLGIDALFTPPEGYVSATNGNFYDVTPDGQRFLMGRVVDESGVVPRLVLVQNFFELLRAEVGGD